MTTIAFLLIALGSWLAYGQRSREHRRLNALGVEVFSSYGAKLRAKAMDAIAWLAAATLVTVGVVVLAVQYESSWGWLILLPLYAWMLFMVFGT
jgi:hypothetical protein